LVEQIRERFRSQHFGFRNQVRQIDYVSSRYRLAVNVSWWLFYVTAQGQTDASVKAYAPVPHAFLEEQAALVFASLTRRLGLGIEGSGVG